MFHFLPSNLLVVEVETRKSWLDRVYFIDFREKNIAVHGIFTLKLNTSEFNLLGHIFRVSNFQISF